MEFILPLLDLLVKISPAKSESENPTICGAPPPSVSPTCLLLYTNFASLLSALYAECEGLLLNLLSRPELCYNF